MAWGLRIGKVQALYHLRHTTPRLGPEKGCRLEHSSEARRLSHDWIIRRATPADGDAILAAMRPWNMHHVPSAEMDSLDLSCFFVAEVGGAVVGASGYRILGEGRGKTTLLAVVPEYLGSGIGAALQEARLQAMAALGVHTVTTNADRPETIRWYKSRYGYREVGQLQKIHSFGHPDIDHWTTLELDLSEYLRRTGAKGMAGD